MRDAAALNAANSKATERGHAAAQGAKPDSRSLLSISNAVTPWVAGSLAMGRWRGEEAH
jgi:hypothetical protein